MPTSGDSGGPAPDRAALDRLENAVSRLLAELEDTRSSNGPDPRDLARRVRVLEDENEDLRERLSGGHEIAERLMAKIRFLEEKG